MGAILALLIAGSLGVGYLVGTSNQRTIMETTTTRMTTTTTETHSLLPQVQITSLALQNRTVGSYVVLNITFKNVGDIPIFTYTGGGSLVSFTLEPRSAIMYDPSSCGPFLQIPVIVTQFNPGQTSYLSIPFCEKFVQSGTVTIDGALRWWPIRDNQTIIYISTASQNFTIH